MSPIGPRQVHCRPKRAVQFVRRRMRVGLWQTASRRIDACGACGSWCAMTGLQINWLPTSMRTAKLGPRTSAFGGRLGRSQMARPDHRRHRRYDANLNLIKGGARALLQEKDPWRRHRPDGVTQNISKVRRTARPIPTAPSRIIPFGWQTTKTLIENAY